MKFFLAFAAGRRHFDDPCLGLLPVGLLTMAACLQRAGHQVQVAHLARFSRGDALRLITTFDPDVVGFSCFTFNRGRTLELVQALRDEAGGKRPCIVVGGPHATPLAAEFLRRAPAVDAVAVGEAERTVVELAGRLARGEPLAGLPGLVARGPDGSPVEGPPRPLIEDLDEVASVAAEDLTLLGVDKLFQLRHLVTARGCTAECVFCCAPGAWGRRVRRHSVARVLADLEALRRRYGLVQVSFRDDTFTADRDFVRELCARLQAERPDLVWDCQSRVTALDQDTVDAMRRAGCSQIQIGVESGSDQVLEHLKKPFRVEHVRAAAAACRAAGVPVSLYLISGSEEEREPEFTATLKLARELRPSSISSSRLALYPGTPLAANIEASTWFEVRDESIFVRADPQSFDFDRRLELVSDDVLRHEPFSAAELEAAGSRLGWPPVARLMLAQLLEREGRPAAARTAYETLLAERPGHPWGELGLGDLRLECREPAEAEPHLRRAVAAVPSWPYAQDRLGWALRYLGRDREADSLLTEARRLEPYVDPPPPPPRPQRGGT